MRTGRFTLLHRSAALRWVLLGLWGLLAGCASGQAGIPLGGAMEFEALRYRPCTPAVASPAQPRIVLAANDTPASRGESSVQATQGYEVPGRNQNSQMPWEFFLGNAAHRLIAYMYKVDHPERIAYFNNQTLLTILAEIGDLSRLLPPERNLLPDITDISIRHVFEIKPWSQAALLEGQQEVQIYVTALNRALLIGRRFTGGTDFQGSILIRFAQGQYIWRLEWQTTAPGVVQYRWTRSQQRFESAAEAADAGQWVSLSAEEMRQYGGWVGQAVEGMVTRREQLAALSGTVGVVIDVVGNGAVSFFWGAILGRMNSGTGAQQPPTQGGGQVIPFPARPPPAAPAPRMPSAVGM